MRGKANYYYLFKKTLTFAKQSTCQSIVGNLILALGKGSAIDGDPVPNPTLNAECQAGRHRVPFL